MEQLFKAQMNASSRLTKAVSLVPSLLFGGLFLFEILNLFGVLSYQVDFTWRGRVLSTFVLFILMRTLDQVVKQNTDIRLRGILWFFACILILLDFIGDVFHFYANWSWYDQMVHFLSGPFITIGLYVFFRSIGVKYGWRVPEFIICLLAFTTNVTFATLYEVEEYLEDFFYHTNRLGDGPDTANDLMLNILAGLGMMVFLFLFQRHQQTRREQKQLERRTNQGST